MTVKELIRELEDLCWDEGPVTVADRYNGRRYEVIVESGRHSGVILRPIGDHVN